MNFNKKRRISMKRRTWKILSAQRILLSLTVTTGCVIRITLLLKKQVGRDLGNMPTDTVPGDR